MTYNKQNLPGYVETAGKITILTALTGILIFAFIFILNIGKTELNRVEAATGTATTSVTVLNTPPVWVVGEEGREEFQSSTSTPTNSGRSISWVGRAIDSNGAPYFMIICSNSATPTAGFATSTLGTVPPACVGGTQWAVSTSTLSGNTARAATTTTEIAPYAELNNWFSWVCDDDPVNPRCSTAYSTGTAATNSEPFYVNRRPVFTSFNNSGPTPPGGTITFNSTSSDPDVVTSADRVFLIVCGTASYSTTTNACGAGDTVASTTAVGPFTNASTSRVLASILQDTNYNAFPYIFDEHGHSATGGAQGVNVAFTVSNVAPTVANASIVLNATGTDFILTQEAGQTVGFRLDFIAADANSCVTAASTSEITSYVASVFRSGIGSTTCNGSAGSYNNNSCYPSGVPTSTWNLVCTASSTSCTGALDDTVLFNCTFPLWFTADPTDGVATDTPFYAQNWAAAVAGVDNNNATGTMTTGNSPVEMLSYVAISLQTSLIAYSQLEPGTNMPNLTATTTLRAVGNTGINQLLSGDSMCGTYTGSTPCPVSSTSTIPQNQQRFSTTTNAAYAAGTQLTATTSPTLLDIRIPKSISTSTPSSGITYWGIAVPGTISLAGSYTGRNTFMGARSATNTW